MFKLLINIQIIQINYIANLVWLQSYHPGGDLLIGGGSKTQPAIVTITKGEQFTISGHHGTVFESAGQLQ